jgi:tRNA threonylcarbamoyladenosine biosynthesis protein TsaB
MHILALDSSTARCSVALLRSDGALFEQSVVAGQTHAERMPAMVESVLGAAAIDLGHVDAFAFGAGPGSFTGLRIACGLVQGLAFALGKPVIPVNTLLTIAASVEAADVCCALDARMGQAYVAAFRSTGGQWQTVLQPMLIDPDAAPQLPAGDWLLAGRGFAAYPQLARQLCPGAPVHADIEPEARVMCRLALAAYARGEAVSAAEAQPVYVRDKVALTTAEQHERFGRPDERA